MLEKCLLTVFGFDEAIPCRRRRPRETNSAVPTMYGATESIQCADKNEPRKRQENLDRECGVVEGTYNSHPRPGLDDE